MMNGMGNTSDYSEYLFNNYRQTHGDYSGTKMSRGGTRRHFREIYLNDLKPIFDRAHKNANILEIGCNMGGMLYEMWADGFRNIEGIDLSPDDIRIASGILPEAIKLECVDAFDYLEDKNEEYDIIFSKAVFEHIKKERIIPLLKKCNRSLKPGGMIIIRVPNMDWIIANHERYMDFTHEVGFNENSLGQVMRSVFGNCTLSFVNDHRIQNDLKGRLARYLIRGIYKSALPTINERALFAREIMGVSKKNKPKDYAREKQQDV